MIKEDYSYIARNSCGCCCMKREAEQISRSIGYSDEEISAAPDANLGLGCGNPIALAEIKPGDTILDLGSGAGFDSFLASKKTGESGRVFGVDFSEEMVKKATENARKYNYKNVEFVLGDIEDLPIHDNSIDLITSNCVINLAQNKDKVFREASRVLKKGGKMFVSDIVLLGQLTKEQQEERELISGCVAGALQKEEYIQKIKNAGFSVKILGEDKDISKRQYSGIALESLKIKAIKL